MKEDSAPEVRLWQVPAWRSLVAISAVACFWMLPIAVGAQVLSESLAVVGAMTALGTILAQGCLLAVWLAWGDVGFGRRLVQHWIVAAALCLLWLAGLFVVFLAGLLLGDRGDDELPAIGATVAMTVPLISLATQCPLWAMRQIFGWRLVRGAGSFVEAPEPAWSIRDLFVATSIAAIAFGLARLSPAFIHGENIWIAWVMGGTAACVITCMTILPAAVMLMRIEPFERGVRYSWLYAASYVALLWLTVGFIRWYGVAQLPPWYAFLGMSFLILAFAGTVILAAKVARALGYRLVTRSRRTQAAWTLHPAA